MISQPLLQQQQQQQPQQQPPQQIPAAELVSFKSNLKQWLEINKQITEMNHKMKELKKIKNKTLEPLITQFMVQYNIKDVNTDNGPVKCNQRNTKKPLNKNVIRASLSQIITDSITIDQAMTLIDQREIKTTYQLVGPKLPMK
jgi:hypothetical protein